MNFCYIKNGKTIYKSKQLSINQAVKFLTENPDNIYEAWRIPHLHIAGALFKRVSESGGWTQLKGVSCGCLTEIRYTGSGEACAAFKKGEVDLILTEMIRLDTNIPVNGGDIRREHLPRFAMWQRFVAEWMKL